MVTPGPVSITIISQSPHQGWMTGALVATGHAVLEFVIVIMIVLGLRAGFMNPHIQRVIAIAVGGLLVWIGAILKYKLFRSK